MDIKQEDLIRLWRWCGLVEQETGSWYENKIGGKYISATMPTLTLDHLYKFAIPKLQDKGYDIDLGAHRKGGFIANIIHFKLLTNIMLDKKYESEYSDSPTEALYNAIMKVIDNGVK